MVHMQHGGSFTATTPTKPAPCAHWGQMHMISSNHQNARAHAHALWRSIKYLIRSFILHYLGTSIQDTYYKVCTDRSKCTCVSLPYARREIAHKSRLANRWPKSANLWARVRFSRMHSAIGFPCVRVHLSVWEGGKGSDKMSCNEPANALPVASSVRTYCERDGHIEMISQRLQRNTYGAEL